MNPIEIDAGELLLALEGGDGMSEWYLDRRTGGVIFISLELDTDEDQSLQSAIESEPERYLFIDPIVSSEAWQTMADFIASVADPALATDLERCIHGRHPFRAFKDALLEHPAERERWFSYKDTAYLQKAQMWLADNGVDARLLNVPR